MKYNLRNILGRYLGLAVEGLPTERKALLKTYLRQLVEATNVVALRNDMASTLKTVADSGASVIVDRSDVAARELRRIKRQVGPGSWEYNWKPMLQELLDED